MPAPSLLFIVGVLLIISWGMRALGMRTPFRVSSLPAGTPTRPLIYTLMEDIVAVDGSGGQEWRVALNARYEASPIFRHMLDRLNVFWGFASVALAIALTSAIFTVPVTVAYGLGLLHSRDCCNIFINQTNAGWAVPFIWAGIWALLTFRYVRYRLAEEKSDILLEGPSPIASLREFMNSYFL